MIYVFGSFVVDLVCNCNKLPEPGETILANGFDMGPGGKGQNQAVQAHLIHGHQNVCFITKTGNDHLANVGKTFWQEINLNVKDYLNPSLNIKTGAALIMVNSQNAQNIISVAPGACLTFSEDEILEIINNIENKNSIFLTQLETNLDAAFLALKMAKEKGLTTILNPAPMNQIPDFIFNYIDFFTPNETEAANALNWDHVTLDNVEQAADIFLNKGVKNCVITMGKNGCFFKNKEITKFFPAFKVQAIDTTGAGDSFNGALAAFLDKKYSILDAISMAQAAAALSVTKHGTAKSMFNFEQIHSFYTQQLTN